MRTVLIPIVAGAALIASASLAAAAPVAVPDHAAAAALTLVKQGCGHGFQRGADAKLDKWGKWHGGCVPRSAKPGAPMARDGGPGISTRQLNQQELSRVQTAPSPSR